MKIKLLSRYAGVRGNFNPGSVIDVPSKEAAQLIGGGYAIEVVEFKVQEIETATIKPIETADIKVKPAHKINWRKK